MKSLVTKSLTKKFLFFHTESYIKYSIIRRFQNCNCLASFNNCVVVV